MTNEDESVMHAIRSLELQAEMRGVAKGRAEGAAAERARLVAVVRGRLADETAGPDGVVEYLDRAALLEAMGAEEVSAGE